MKDNLGFLENHKLQGSVSVIGVPLDLGKDSIGTDKGPAAIRKEGLVSILENTGLKVFDLGDIPCPDKTMAEVGELSAKYLEPIIKVSNEVGEVVSKEIRNGNKIVALGGDNAVSIGTLSGAGATLEGDLGVIWIDAHGDINTVETTISGNVHGMPISAVLGIAHPKLTDVYKPGIKLKPENLLYIGIRDLDQAEIDLIRKHRIPFVTMLEMVEKGLRPAFEAISELSKKVKHVWVCLDIDSIDEQWAPGTPMATKGGLTYRESVSLAKYIGKICNVVGVDVTELAPDLDESNKTSKLAVELVINYLGGEANWYTQYMQEEAKKQALRQA